MATARGEIHLSLRGRNDFDLLEQTAPLITNTLVGISAEPSPTRTTRIARRRAAVAPPNPTQEVVSGGTSTVVTFDESGRQVESAKIQRKK